MGPISPLWGTTWGAPNSVHKDFLNDVRSRSCDVKHDVSSWLDRCTEQSGVQVV